MRGDSDCNGTLTLADAIHGLLYLFAGGDAPCCLETADTDDSDSLDISDAILFLGFLFLNGPPPAAPFPVCGPEPQPDVLDCAAYPSC